jgi:AraC family transcriptional regulator, ethanolamine operon transcriptional activator
VSSTILQRRFNDIDQLAKHLQVFSKIQLTQLSTDRLKCDVWGAIFDDAQFVFAETSCSIRCLGSKHRKTINFNLVLEARETCLISHNRKVPDHTLLGFAPDWETSMILPSKLLLATVLIKRDVLQDYLQIMERSDLDERFWASNYVHAPITLMPIKAYLTQLSSLILSQPDTLRQPYFNQLVLEDFMPLFINSIPPVTQDILQPPSPMNRAKIVKQVEDYMMDHIDQPLTLKDICQAVYSSRTPVFSAFQEVFGLGPMEYLKVQRLHTVRRMLKVADPKTDSVTAIAQKYGFWSAGHFTRDYKQMFGELPSKTLKRA